MIKVIHTKQKGETTTLRGNGSAPIAMVDFTHVDMSRYKDEVVVKLLPIRPAFKKEAWNDQSRMVNMDHACVVPTTLNIREWSREIKYKLFGKQLNHRLDDACNEHLFQLMNPGKNEMRRKNEILDLEFICLPQRRMWRDFCLQKMESA